MRGVVAPVIPDSATLHPGYLAQSNKPTTDNFFVLAPNLTIYNKLIADFSDRNHRMSMGSERAIADDRCTLFDYHSSVTTTLSVYKPALTF